MSAQRKVDTISRDEYFDILLNGDIKYEWFNGQMWPKENPDNMASAPKSMAGAQPNHSRLKNNFETRVSRQLENSSCEVMSGDQLVRIEASDINTFPDVVIFCENARFETVRGLETLLSPIVLAEILSPSTARFDLTDKWAHYQLIPSLRDYLVIFCDQMRVQHYTRQSDDSWNQRVLSRPDDVIRLSGVAAQTTLRELYQRVVFPEETTSRLPRLV